MPDFSIPPKSPKSPFADLRQSHTCLRVQDYEAEKTWFVETLGFRLVMLGFRLVIEWPGPVGVKMCYVAAPNDDSCIIEIVGDGDPPVARPEKSDLFASLGVAGYHHVCFRVTSVDDTTDLLRERGVAIVADPFEVAGISRRLAFISDPAGNLFELEQVL